MYLYEKAYSTALSTASLSLDTSSVSVYMCGDRFYRQNINYSGLLDEALRELSCGRACEDTPVRGLPLKRPTADECYFSQLCRRT
jgi:hypothetical protein